MSNTLERVQSPMSKVQSPVAGFEPLKLVVFKVRDIRSEVKFCAGSGGFVFTTLDFGRWTLDLVLIYFERSGPRFRKVHLEVQGGRF